MPGGRTPSSVFTGAPSFGPVPAPRGRAPSQDDLAFIAARRAQRASWQAIGAMLGMSVHDLRLRCDPGYEPPAWLGRIVVGDLAPAKSAPKAARREWAGPLGGKRAWGSAKALVLEMLGRAPGELRSRDMRVELGATNQNMAGRLIRLRAEGLVVSRPSGGSAGEYLWSLTDKGRGHLQQIKQGEWA